LTKSTFQGSNSRQRLRIHRRERTEAAGQFLNFEDNFGHKPKV
jgi:hypothetical protein